jgi:hypothetical protein
MGPPVDDAKKRAWELVTVELNISALKFGVCVWRREGRETDVMMGDQQYGLSLGREQQGRMAEIVRYTTSLR